MTTNSVPTMIHDLGLEDLHSCRQNGKTIMMHGIFNNLIDIPIERYLIPSGSLRRGHAISFRVPYCSVNAYMDVSIATNCNSLPVSAVTPPSIIAFMVFIGADSLICSYVHMDTMLYPVFKDYIFYLFFTEVFQCYHAQFELYTFLEDKDERCII